MSAALDAVKAFEQARADYMAAYPGRILEDDLHLYNELQGMADTGELLVSVEEAFDRFVDARISVSMVMGAVDMLYVAMSEDAWTAAEQLGLLAKREGDE